MLKEKNYLKRFYATPIVKYKKFYIYIIEFSYFKLQIELVIFQST